MTELIAGVIVVVVVAGVVKYATLPGRYDVRRNK